MNYIIILIFDKFSCFVFLLIVNQSIIVKIPHNPPVSSFNIPIPISPIINLSTPSVPKKIEASNITVGSFNSVACNVNNESSDAFSNFCLIIGIADGSKYLAFVVRYKSIF